MQTTLRFDDALMRQVKAEAARMGVTLTQYIEDALRQCLRSRSGRGSPRASRKVRLPVSRATGGFAPGIRDLEHAAAVVDDADVADLLSRRA